LWTRAFRGMGGTRSEGARLEPVRIESPGQSRAAHLRHSKSHVTRERYIKVFDRTLLEAVEKVQTRIEELRQVKVGPQQLPLKFGDLASL